MWVSLLILIIFIGILISLGSALFYLNRDQGDSKRTLHALTIRISLSVGLFALLMVLIAFDVIQPHGLYPPNSQ